MSGRREKRSGSIGALCKMSDAIFKRLLLQQLSSRFNHTLQKACIREKYKLLLFLALCQSLKVYDTLKINYLSYFASIDKAMLVSSGKRSSRPSRPPGLLLFHIALRGSWSHIKLVAWIDRLERKERIWISPVCLPVRFLCADHMIWKGLHRHVY